MCEGGAVDVLPTPATVNSMSGPDRPVEELSDGRREPMTEAEARAATERIRAATRYVCLLLLEVHERRGWVALGYANWEQYVQAEFGISRSRSYELLDQAKVIEGVKQASGLTTIPDISAYAALQIKHRLPEVVETIRRRIDGTLDQAAVDIVVGVVAEYRRRAVRDRRDRRHQQGVKTAGDSTHFVEAINVLARMPATRQTQDLLDTLEPTRIESIELARHWLTELLSEWRKRSLDPITVGL